jgi:hypothetical protein
MAYAMMGGIIVGTLLTLLFLPALYVAWFRIKVPGASEVAGSLPGADSERPAGGVGGGCGYDLDPHSKD